MKKLNKTTKILAALFVIILIGIITFLILSNIYTTVDTVTGTFTIKSVGGPTINVQNVTMKKVVNVFGHEKVIAKGMENDLVWWLR